VERKQTRDDVVVHGSLFTSGRTGGQARAHTYHTHTHTRTGAQTPASRSSCEDLRDNAVSGAPRGLTEGHTETRTDRRRDPAHAEDQTQAVECWGQRRCGASPHWCTPNCVVSSGRRGKDKQRERGSSGDMDTNCEAGVQSARDARWPASRAGTVAHRKSNNQPVTKQELGQRTWRN
jgi:hypothetical protein